ncbi:MAG: Gfo/Idh/MocA family oxidoreductase [Clostridia bacterium]|nr:Gfo/Idh/MocA family oxidoreductase [Clostridia bacterium]
MRVGILGCGGIARKMALTLRLMKENGEDVCLYAAAARDLERAQAFCREEGFQQAYGSYADMVKDPQVDLVYIATPHSHHYEHMLLCIENGKAVLCEKAFTANADQARKALALAKERKVLVAEAIWTRYMPSRQIISEAMASGAIGEPRLLTANLHYPIENKERLRNPALAGGALLDVGIYPLTFAAMFFGDDFKKAESSVQLLETGVDRQENMTLYYADGRMAQLSAGMTCRSDRLGYIGGTQGYIQVENVNNPEKITLYKTEEEFAIPHEIPLPKQLTGYEYQVRACMEALQKGQLECPQMPHADTIRMMELMDRFRAQWDLVYPFEVEA